MDNITKKDINKLINYDKEPCLSFSINTRKDAGDVKKMNIKYKNLLAKAEKMLENDWGFNPAEIKKILKKGKKLIGERTFWQHQNEGLVLFLGQNFFTYYRIPSSVKDYVHVSKYFNIIDIISEATEKEKYYILALSSKYSRFFQAGKTGIQKIDIEDMPKNIEEVDEDVVIEEESKNRSQSSVSSGQQMVFHGQDIGEKKPSEKLIKYLKQINLAIKKFSKGNKKPLILICAKDLFPLYQEINSYTGILDTFISGNPDKMDSEKIQESTWEEMRGYFADSKSKLINHYNNLKNTEKTSNEVKDIVTASVFGKVEKLLLAKNNMQPGKYVAKTNQVFLSDKADSEFYDLYNFTAIKCFSAGAKIYFLEDEEMPGNSEIAAIYRY